MQKARGEEFDCTRRQFEMKKDLGKLLLTRLSKFEYFLSLQKKGARIMHRKRPLDVQSYVGANFLRIPCQIVDDFLNIAHSAREKVIKLFYNICNNAQKKGYDEDPVMLPKKGPMSARHVSTSYVGSVASVRFIISFISFHGLHLRLRHEQCALCMSLV